MNRRATKSVLRRWILARNTGIQPQELADDTLILKGRILTSLQLMDLILFLEELRERAIKTDCLRPGAFDTVDAIYETFLQEIAS